MLLVLAVTLVMTAQFIAGCGGKNPVGPEVQLGTLPIASDSVSVSTMAPVLDKPVTSLMATRTTGYQAYATQWIWDGINPHFALKFNIPHSTYSVQRYLGIPDGGYDGGLNNWTSSRTNLGNGTDMYILLVPKRLRAQYWYISDWDFSRYFWLWCTYNA
jgi:hypothetical protein